MGTHHIVGVKVTCWQLGDRRSRPFLNEGSDEYIDECLWVVGGELVTNTYKDKTAIETALTNATVEHETTNLAGQIDHEYEVVKEVMRFEFRMIGVGYIMESWGALDMLAKEIGLDDLIEPEIDELVRIARRELESEKHADGSYHHHQITLATVWDHDEFSNGDDYDEEWSYIGELPLTGALWDCIKQEPGDQCAKCRGSGLQYPVDWRLDAKDRPPCPRCLNGRIALPDPINVLYIVLYIPLGSGNYQVYVYDTNGTAYPSSYATGNEALSYMAQFNVRPGDSRDGAYPEPVYPLLGYKRAIFVPKESSDGVA